MRPTLGFLHLIYSRQISSFR